MVANILINVKLRSFPTQDSRYFRSDGIDHKWTSMSEKKRNTNKIGNGEIVFHTVDIEVEPNFQDLL